MVVPFNLHVVFMFSQGHSWWYNFLIFYIWCLCSLKVTHGGIIFQYFLYGVYVPSRSLMVV